MHSLRNLIRKTLLESHSASSGVFYHGTRTTIPFARFDPQSERTGVVSSGTRYGGFFFTSEKENAEFYTEWFVCTAKINDIFPEPLDSTHPPTILKQAALDKKIYKVEDVFDGAMHSDIVVVPMSNLSSVEIVGWEFVGDKDFYFEMMDRFFDMDADEEDESFITQSSIESLFHMIHVDISYALSIPVFREYYDSKEEG